MLGRPEGSERGLVRRASGRMLRDVATQRSRPVASGARKEGTESRPGYGLASRHLHVDGVGLVQGGQAGSQEASTKLRDEAVGRGPGMCPASPPRSSIWPAGSVSCRLPVAHCISQEEGSGANERQGQHMDGLLARTSAPMA